MSKCPKFRNKNLFTRHYYNKLKISEITMAPHLGSATSEQIEALLNFLDEHKDLARGQLRSIEGKVLAKRLWNDLCLSLNSMGGCTKTLQQWQKVWFDRKHMAKKAAADARRSASATGGGPSTAHPLTHWERKILSIMVDGFGERQTTARVPAFDEIQPSTTSQPIITIEVSRDPSPLEETEPASQLTASRSSPLPSRSRPTPSRSRPTRRAAAASDVRSRLFQLEEERVERENGRNAELAGIKNALLQLCGLLGEFLGNIVVDQNG